MGSEQPCVVEDSGDIPRNPGYSIDLGSDAKFCSSLELRNCRSRAGSKGFLSGCKFAKESFGLWRARTERSDVSLPIQTAHQVVAAFYGFPEHAASDLAGFLCEFEEMVIELNRVCGDPSLLSG